MPSDSSTAAAAQSAPSRDAAAAPSFERVFHDHAPFVWRALRRLGVHEADVEDVCQEVFLVVHRRLADFEGRSSLRTWIYGICVRSASDWRRKPHRSREAPVDPLPEPRIPAPQHEELERRRAVEALDRALDRLDEAHRAVFVLYEIEGLSMNEIAEALGCPLQTGYSRLHAARRQIEATLRRSEIERRTK